MAAMRTMLRDRTLPIGEPSIEESETGNEDSEDIDFSDRGQPSTRDSEIPSRAQNQSLSPGQWHGQDASCSESSVWSTNTPPLTQNIVSPESLDGDDIIDRGVVSLDMANELISLFIHKLAKYFPVVVLPEQTSAAQLRHTKPVLFLSVLQACCCAESGVDQFVRAAIFLQA